MFGVTILGNNSAIPAFDRHPTSQVVTANDQLFLIDCGEGTQMQLARYKVKKNKINHIFISHLHGDHYFGLPGLISSMGLLSRENDLHLYAPAPLFELLDKIFEAAVTALPFVLHKHPIQGAGVLWQNDRMRVSCFPTEHRIECYGFRFDELKAPRKLDPEKAIAHEIPAAYYDQLKWGKDYTNKKGELIKNEGVTEAAPSPRSYAYCADTRYLESIVPHIQGVNLVYHETTYLKDQTERAEARYHSTTHQAASIAQKAGAQKLIVGHFSSKYEKLDAFLEEVKELFPNSELALEGISFRIL
jgi:ribonuclease Z